MTRPNILFLFTDDQRFDTIGALGNPHIHTPAMDRLVGQGVACTQAYIMGGSHAAVCMPSRAMLHTGRHLFGIDGCGETVPDGHHLLGQTLRDAGYQCFGTGKWHNGTQAYARSFTDGGEVFFGGMADHWNVPACDFDPSGRYEQTFACCVDPASSKQTRMVHGDHVHAGRHSSELFADAAGSFLKGRDQSRPFFAYVSFMAPHDPRTMPETYRQMYRDEDMALPPNFMGAHPFNNGELKIRDEFLEDFPRLPERVQEHLADYYAMVSHLDAQIGCILDALDESGEADHTLIVLAGDNGLAVGQHGLMGKQSLYEHSIHVPLIFSGPGLPAGERRDGFCYLTDIFPTLCDAVDVPTPDSVQSRSLWAMLRGEESSVRDRMYHAYRHVQRAVREEQWKYIEYNVLGQRRVQLFNVADDPWELCDLSQAPDQRDRCQQMHDILRTLREDYADDREDGRVFYQDH